MTKFGWDKSMGSFGKLKEEQKTPVQVLSTVQRTHSHRIRANNITEAELLEMINKVFTGTRNIRYLVDPKDPKRLEEVGYTILREVPH